MHSLSRGILFSYNYKSIFNVKEIIKSSAKYSTISLNLGNSNTSNRSLVPNQNKRIFKGIQTPITQLNSNYSSDRHMDSDDSVSTNNVNVMFNIKIYKILQ